MLSTVEASSTHRQAQSDTYFSVLFPVMLSLSKHHLWTHSSTSSEWHIFWFSHLSCWACRSIIWHNSSTSSEWHVFFGSLSCHAELVEASIMNTLFDKLRVTRIFRFFFLSCWACRSIIYEHTLRQAQSDIMIRISLSGWACRSITHSSTSSEWHVFFGFLSCHPELVEAPLFTIPCFSIWLTFLFLPNHY